MSAIALNLPPDAMPKGNLFRSYDKDELDQDVFQVSLASGYTIDVGWWPEYDATGTFQVAVYRDDWDDPVAGPIEAKSTLHVARLVEELAAEYSRPQPIRPRSAAKEQYCEVPAGEWAFSAEPRSAA